jgi:TatD DNase family protein
MGAVRQLDDAGLFGDMDELIDIGVNLTHRSFDRDREHVIERARAAGVSTLILTGTTVAGSRSAALLAKTRPGTLYATAGIHPHHAKEATEKSFADLGVIAAAPEIVAVGECGLDFNRSFSPHDVQERVFEEQLQLARRLAKPVFMHERDASARFAAIMKNHRAHISRGVVHCFTGTEEELRRYLELDLHIGITGWICDERRGKHLQTLVRKIPLDRLMLETDAPFLYPRNLPKRDDRRNEPAFLPSVLEVLARSFGAPLHELARATTATARAFFGINCGLEPATDISQSR